MFNLQFEIIGENAESIFEEIKKIEINNFILSDEEKNNCKYVLFDFDNSPITLAKHTLLIIQKDDNIIIQLNGRNQILIECNISTSDKNFENTISDLKELKCKLAQFEQGIHSINNPQISDLIIKGFEGVLTDWGLKIRYNIELKESKFSTIQKPTLVCFLSLKNHIISNEFQKKAVQTIEITSHNEKQLNVFKDSLIAKFALYLQEDNTSIFDKSEQLLLEENQDIEIKFIIPNEGIFHKIIESFEKEKNIVGYSLGDKTDYRYKEVYYDTKNFTLRNNKSFLRTRQHQGQRRKLMFKASQTDKNAVKSSQIEEDEDYEGLVEIISTMIEKGISFTNVSNLNEEESVTKNLHILGLEPILTMNVKRVYFPLSSKKNIPYGSIKFDHLTFTSNSKNGFFYRVEISVGEKCENPDSLLKLLGYAMNHEYQLSPTNRSKAFLALYFLENDRLPDEGEVTIPIYTKEKIDLKYRLTKMKEVLENKDSEIVNLNNKIKKLEEEKISDFEMKDSRNNLSEKIKEWYRLIENGKTENVLKELLEELNSEISQIDSQTKNLIRTISASYNIKRNKGNSLNNEDFSELTTKLLNILEVLKEDIIN